MRILLAMSNTTTKQMVVQPDGSVELWGLTRDEYLRAALEALHQAGIRPDGLAKAYKLARLDDRATVALLSEES